MRMTIDLDERLLKAAREMTGIQDSAALVHEGLRALVTRESAKRLARLGGSDPDLQRPRRRRP
jgi:Arc/MetJ family transcription regulator